MKIYVLPVPVAVQPVTQRYRYPRGNDDFEIEQQFLDWINKHPELTTSDSRAADFHYLPVYWTRYHVDHDYGKQGQEELQATVSAIIRDDAKTFTICQYDDGPLIDIGRTIQFLAARKGHSGIDVPVLRAPHRLPFFKPKKRYLASFVGRLSTHPMRAVMAESVKCRADVFLHDGHLSVRRFVRTLLASYACLSPRGYGGSSFRTYEAMQLGVAPIIICDRDTRPFRKFIDWDSFSIFDTEPRRTSAILDSTSKAGLLELSRCAAAMYEAHFAKQRWCHYVLEELKALTAVSNSF